MAGFDTSSDDDEVIAQINIIPFVDIVLVLLIIFMVTSAAIVRASIKVELPKAASGGDSVESTLNLVVTRDDVLYLNGEVSSREGVVAFIERELPRNQNLQAVISADQGVPYGSVIGLIDLVKKNGIKAFALNVEPGASAPSPAP